MPGDIHAVLPAALGGNKRMTNAGAILCPRGLANFMFCVDPRGGPAPSAAVRLVGRLPWRCPQLATPPAGMARHSDGSEPSACTIRGRPVPGELLGPLVEFRGALAGPQLQRHMAEHGYLLLRSVVDPVAVQEARACVLASLAELEEVVPLGDDRWTTTSGRSRRHALHGQYGSASLGHFWRGVSEDAALRRVTHGDKLAAVMQALAGGKQCRAQDMVYLRPVCAGACADMHYDYPFFSTGLVTASRSIHTAWVPLGAVSPQDGALCIVEQSHRFSDLLDELQATDFGTVSQDSFQALAFPAVGHPVDEARARGVRLLSASLEPGDAIIIIFSMGPACMVHSITTQQEARCGSPQTFAGTSPPQMNWTHGTLHRRCLAATAVDTLQ